MFLNWFNVYLCKIFISKVANEQSSQKKDKITLGTVEIQRYNTILHMTKYKRHNIR